MNGTKLNLILLVTDNVVAFIVGIVIVSFMFLLTGFNQELFERYVPGIAAQTAVLGAIFGSIFGTDTVQRFAKKSH